MAQFEINGAMVDSKFFTKKIKKRLLMVVALFWLL